MNLPEIWNELYKEGKTVREIADMYGLERYDIEKWIDELRPRGPRLAFPTVESLKELNRLYNEEHMSVRQLAERYGLHPSTISRHLWHPRRGQNQHTVGKKDV